MTRDEIARLADQNRDVLGVLDGKRAFTGPRWVQIDLTNSCNSACIACWARSPLLGDARMPPEEQALSLPTERVVRLIDEVAEMGTREVYLGGGGDPLCHPGVLDVIERARRRGLSVTLHSNFTKADDDVVDRLIDVDLDALTVSLWAADELIYLETHPTRSVAAYRRLIETLRRLLDRRRRGRPVVKLYHVICKPNHDQIPKMFEQAAELGVDGMELAPLDTIPGYTESLLLSKEEIYVCLQHCREIAGRVRGREDQFPILHGLERFVARMSSPKADQGIYDLPIADAPCYVGWLFTRVMADGKVTPCLKGDRHPVGDILQQEFAEIWNGRLQRRFRNTTRKPRKTGRFFRAIGKDQRTAVGCTRSCDDISRNEELVRRMETLGEEKIDALRRFARSRTKDPATD